MRANDHRPSCEDTDPITPILKMISAQNQVGLCPKSAGRRPGLRTASVRVESGTRRGSAAAFALRS